MEKVLHQIKNKSIVVVALSLLFAVFWGISLLSAGDVNRYTAFNGLMVTFLGVSYLRRQWAEDVNVYLYLIGPLAYILIAVFAQQGKVFSTMDPLFWVTALLLFALFAYKLNFWVSLFIALVYSFFYARFFFHVPF